MTSSSPEPFSRNMTEILFPNQSLDTRPQDYPLAANVDWLLPNNFTSGSRLQPQDSAKQPTSAVLNTPSSSTSPQSRDESFPSQHLPQTTFKGLEEHMTQGNNPFQNIPSGLIPQPILSSNVRASTSSQPQQQQPQPQQQRRQQLSQQSPTPRSFAPIAPDPIGLQRMQAVRQNQEVEENQHSKKRRLTQPSMEAPQPAPLKDDDKLLLQLKDEQQLPWKNIVSRFQQETGKVHAIAALQMRYKRLKDRLQVWTDPDIEALTQAHDYWESRKFDIISAKMLEFGATEKFSALACRRKWQELHPTAEYPLHQIPAMAGAGPPPFSSSSSPQPTSHSTAYTSLSPPYQLPHPHGSVYSTLPPQPSVTPQSSLHSHGPHPSHSQPGYSQPGYGSYVPVTQQQQQQTTYRQSPPQTGHPHPPAQTSYAASPQTRFSNYSQSGAHHSGQPGPPPPGSYWHSS